MGSVALDERQARRYTAQVSEPAYHDARSSLWVGDVRAVLREFPADSVHCVVTSPPYWGLRNYGIAPTVWAGPDDNCAHEWEARAATRPPTTGGVNAFSETRAQRERVLRPWDERWHHGGLHPEAGNPGDRRLRSGQMADGEPAAFCTRCGCWRGQLGLEPTVGLYVEHLVMVFDELWRVLRPDGVAWLNLGDCYHTGDGYQKAPTLSRHAKGIQRSNPHSDLTAPPNRQRQAGLKPKDLVGVPWRVAFALQERGWWLRSAVTWAKGLSFCDDWHGSVMPESIRDRPTSASEMLFLLSRSETYFYDREGCREKAVRWDEARYDPGLDGHGGGGHSATGRSTRRFSAWQTPSGWDMEHQGEDPKRGRYANDAVKAERREAVAGRDRESPRQAEGTPVRSNQAMPPQPGEPGAFGEGGTRNLRNVWAIMPEPFDRELCRRCGTVYEGLEYGRLHRFKIDGRAAVRCGQCQAEGDWLSHFATFPPDLVRPCVQLGSSEGGACARCGAPRERVLRRAAVPTDAGRSEGAKVTGTTEGLEGRAHDQHRRLGQAYQEQLDADPPTTVGWAPTCAHADAGIAPCVVLDPFAGSGTTLEVARDLGRTGWGVELSPDYGLLVAHRLRQAVLF